MKTIKTALFTAAFMALINFAVALPPDDPNVSMSPVVVYANTSVLCAATYLDPEGDDGELLFDIYIDGMLENKCNYSVSNGSHRNCTQEYDAFVKGRVINCTVSAVDNNSLKTVSSLSKMIANAPPTTPSLLLPSSGIYSVSVFMNCSGSTDYDGGDIVSYDLETNVSGNWTTLSDAGNGTYLWDTSAYTQKDVGLRCRATDSFDNSSFILSTIDLDNTPPSLSLNLTASDHDLILDRYWAYVEFYSDSLLSSCFVDWDGVNHSANVSDSTCFFNRSDLEGNHSFRGWANDSANNWNHSTKHWVFFPTTTSTSTTSTTRYRRSGGGGLPPNPAKPKPSCFDGIQNCHGVPRACEEGVDCGGPCDPCMSCDDGIQNQGETGIDCGGPCKACPTTTSTTSTTTSTSPKKGKVSISSTSLETATSTTEPEKEPPATAKGEREDNTAEAAALVLVAGGIGYSLIWFLRKK